MSDIEKHKDLTNNKGWNLVKKVGRKVLKGVSDVVTPTTLIKVSEKIQEIKDKKKRGPRDA